LRMTNNTTNMTTASSRAETIRPNIAYTSSFVVTKRYLVCQACAFGSSWLPGVVGQWLATEAIASWIGCRPRRGGAASRRSPRASRPQPPSDGELSHEVTNRVLCELDRVAAEDLSRVTQSTVGAGRGAPLRRG
jgi:hypothetical protein